MAREDVPLIVIQRQLGHSNLGITSVCLQGIDRGEIMETRARPTRTDAPVSASLRLSSTASVALLVAHCSTGCPATASARGRRKR
jgi:hypothetical protein